MSLSARRAWIEIISQIKTVTGCVVALRKESVDRNDSSGAKADSPTKWSLSARRAWIEIALVVSACNFFLSLSARRAWIEITSRRRVSGRALRRSPQGERG